MPIIQASSYAATIQPPLPAENYSAIRVTFAQGQNLLVEKTLEDLLIENGLVVVQLSGEETLDFLPGIPATMQIRCYHSEYDAPGSRCWLIPVLASNDTEVLP